MESPCRSERAEPAQRVGRSSVPVSCYLVTVQAGIQSKHKTPETASQQKSLELFWIFVVQCLCELWDIKGRKVKLHTAVSQGSNKQAGASLAPRSGSDETRYQKQVPLPRGRWSSRCAGSQSTTMPLCPHVPQELWSDLRDCKGEWCCSAGGGRWRTGRFSEQLVMFVVWCVVLWVPDSPINSSRDRQWFCR